MICVSWCVQIGVVVLDARSRAPARGCAFALTPRSPPAAPSFPQRQTHISNPQPATDSTLANSVPCLIVAGGKGGLADIASAPEELEESTSGERGGSERVHGTRLKRAGSESLAAHRRAVFADWLAQQVNANIPRLYRQRVRTASCQSVRRQSVRRPHAQVALTRRRKAALLSLVVIVAGCATVVPFEMLNTRDRGCGDLISLMEYACAAIASAPVLRRKQNVPWQAHGMLMVCAVAYSALCNQALALVLPMPVFLVLKNGSLAANMVVGWLVGTSFQAHTHAVSHYE